MCPAGLVLQWTGELRRFLKWGSFAVLPYLGGCTDANRRGFWSEWNGLAAPPERRIILASLSVSATAISRARALNILLQAVKEDASFYFNDPLNPGDRPRPISSNPNGLEQFTLFTPGRDWGVLILDEAHMLRLPNKFNMGATELRHAATFTVAMTATPVLTSPMVRIRPDVSERY